MRMSLSPFIIVQLNIYFCIVFDEFDQVHYVSESLCWRLKVLRTTYYTVVLWNWGRGRGMRNERINGRMIINMDPHRILSIGQDAQVIKTSSEKLKPLSMEEETRELKIIWMVLWLPIALQLPSVANIYFITLI